MAGDELPPRTSRRSSRSDEKNRLSVPIPSTTPASRQASIARTASALFKVSGFSQKTAFPAFATAMIISTAQADGRNTSAQGLLSAWKGDDPNMRIVAEVIYPVA